MKYWITTDTHFNHYKLLEYGRPNNFEAKIERGFKQIKSSDVLIHLGDICIGKDMEMHNKYIKPLQARGVKTILCRGNHDRKSFEWYLNNGWDFACETFDMKYKGDKIMFSHIPIAYNNNYKYNIHGHFHDSDHHHHEAFIVAIKNNKQILLALEYTNYQPVTIDYLLK